MRYEDAHRLRGVESAWLRLTLWFRPMPRKTAPVIRDLGALSDHERRDIGLPDTVRYMDWRALMEKM
ncbi:hypothetical protein [Microvirga sp. 2MCAF35]|uniref:hypothetical protein n=1 Tax=Microvirga sp. 2MCAF35 TaxID=3232987 RepID=UPI003F9544CD